jgi:hypothetical protein
MDNSIKINNYKNKRSNKKILEIMSTFFIIYSGFFIKYLIFIYSFY